MRMRVLEKQAKELGAVVRLVRKERGYTTISMAKKLDLSQAQVSRLETGIQGFRMMTLLRVCQVLDKLPSELLQRAGL